MTDKAQKPVHKVLANPQVQTDKQESDMAFLERTNVKSILNGLMESLYHHQPDEPINFIYNYFENLSHQEDPLKLATERLKVASHQSTIFEESLLEIYDLFVTSGNNVTGKKGNKISFADLFNRLVDSLVADIPTDIQASLSNKIKRKEYDAFSFKYFRSSIKLIFLLKDFLAECTSMFKDLEAYSDDRVNRLACELILDQLKNSLRIINDPKSNTQSVMQSLYELSPGGLSQAISEKHGKILQSKDNIDMKEFVLNASRHFIDCINLK